MNKSKKSVSPSRPGPVRTTPPVQRAVEQKGYSDATKVRKLELVESVNSSADVLILSRLKCFGLEADEIVMVEGTEEDWGC